MKRSKQVTVDGSGRVSIPKDLRSQLGLHPGAKLDVEALGDDEIRLRLSPERPKLVRKGSVLVAHVELEDDLAGIQQNERDNRLDEVAKRVGL